MSVERTARVLNYLFADLKSQLPPGAGIQLTPHRKWTTVQRADDGSQDLHGIQTMVTRNDQGRPVSGSGSGVTVRDLGPSLRLIPAGARRQLAAKQALDILLELFYPQPHKDGFSKGADYGILTEDRESGARKGRPFRRAS